MKATKFLLLLWALALGSFVGWSQTVNQPVLVMTPGPNASSNVAVCPSGGAVTLKFTAGGPVGSTVQLELRANTSTGPLVNTFDGDGILPLAFNNGVEQNQAVTLPALTAGNTYYLIVNVTNGMLSATNWVTIVPTDFPAGSANFTLNPLTVCLTPGNSSVATVNTPNTTNFIYTFTTNGGSALVALSNTTLTSTTATPSAVGTGDITLTVGYRSMSCGSTTTTQTLTAVSATLPDPIVLVSPPGPQPFCRGTELTLSSACPAGQTPTWFKGDNTDVIGIGSPITVAPNPLDPTDVHTYKVKCRVDGSTTCESEAQSITITTVDQATLAPVSVVVNSGAGLTGVGPVCQTTGNTNFSVTATCPVGTVATWYDDNLPATMPTVVGVSGAGNVQTRIVTISVATAPMTFTDYVTCVKGSCETATRTAYSVSVVPKPDAPTVVTNTFTICANNDPFVAGQENAVTLNATPSTTPAGTTCATINWYSSTDNVTFSTLVGTGGSFTVVGSTAGTTYYKASCVGAAPTACVGEQSAGTITVIVNPIPVAAPTAGLAGGSIATPGRICYNALDQSINVAESCAGAYTAVWTALNGGPAIANDAVTVTVPGALPGSVGGTSYNYELRCRDANGCVSPAVNVSFIIDLTPVAQPIVTPAVVCLNSNPEVVITTTCLPGQTVQWQGSVDGGANFVTLPVTDNTLEATDANLLSPFPGVDALAYQAQLTNDYKLQARCIQTGSSCPAGPYSTVVTTKLRYNEIVPLWEVRLADNTPIARDEIIPVITPAITGTDLCVGTVVKLVQTDLGLTCQGGIVNWYKQTSTDGVNFAPATTSFVKNGSGWVGENSNTVDPTAPGNSDPTTWVKYYARCEAFCNSELSAAKTIVFNAKPTPSVVAISATPSTTSCLEPGTPITIRVDLSGCATGTGITNPQFTLVPIKNGVDQASITFALTVAGNVIAADAAAGTASYNYSVTSPGNQLTDTYTFKASCTRTYDVLASSGGPAHANSTSTCTGPYSSSPSPISVNTKPAAPTNLIVNTPVVCPNTSATLTATCTAGTTLEWFNALDPNTALTLSNVVTVGNTTTANTPALTATTSYVAKCTDANGCRSNASTQVTVQIIPTVKPTLDIYSVVLCPAPAIGPSVQSRLLTVSGCNPGIGETIRWAREGNAETLGTGTTFTVATTGVNASGYYVISAETKFVAYCTRVNGALCEIGSDPVTVGVTADPMVAIQAVPALSVCQGQPLALNAISTSSPVLPIGGYAWVGSGTGLVVPGNQNLSSVSTVNAPAPAGASPAMNGNYYFTANYNSCTFQSPTVVVNVVTTIAPPTITVPTAILCASVTPTMSVTATCAVGDVVWTSVGATGPSVPTPTSNTTYSAKCVLAGTTCESSVASATVMTRPFEITIIDVNKSASNTSGLGTLESWNRIYPFASVGKNYGAATTTMELGGTPNIYTTTAGDRLKLTDFGTPRFWTIDVKVCNASQAVGSIQYIMERLDPTTEAVVQTFGTIENNPPYLQFGNGGMYDLLYTINDPNFGFYTASGVYDAGFPKGKYNLTVKALSLPGVDISYPSNVNRNPAPGSVTVASANYYLNIFMNGGAAREGVDAKEADFATVLPNPVTRTLTLAINGAKGQNVSLNLVDASGRSLMTRSVTPESDSHREEVDMSNSKTGMYFMQVTSPLKNATLKVLKVSQD